MASNASRGAAKKLKTKKWLINRGWAVADAEIVRTIYLGRARKVTQKYDQWGADLFAMCATVASMHVQCKSGAAARGGTFPAARREFAKYPHPPGVRKVVIAWPPQARIPRIVEVFADGRFDEVQAV